MHKDYNFVLAVPLNLCNHRITGCLIEDSSYLLKTGKIICYSPSSLFFNLTFTICHEHLLAISEHCCVIAPNNIVIVSSVM
jgi:hypothetical protein